MDDTHAVRFRCKLAALLLMSSSEVKSEKEVQ